MQDIDVFKSLQKDFLHIKSLFQAGDATLISEYYSELKEKLRKNTSK